MKKRTPPGRPTVEAGRRAVTKPISLYPHQAKFVLHRSLELGMGVSRYFQKLADYDREHNLIADILHAEAKEAAK